MELFTRLPELELSTCEGEVIRLKDHTGHYVVIYFYPRAGTAGCTREAVQFSAAMEEFRKLDAAVLGVSPDMPETQKKFVQSHGLKVTMVSDRSLLAAKAFGALKEDGKMLRSTFLVDRTGTLRWRWRGVKVEGHVQQVLQVVRNLNAADRRLNPLIHTRRARRALSAKTVSKDDLTLLVHAAHLAPSCFNNQPWRLVIAAGKKLKAVKESLSGGNYWARAAPAIIAVTSHRDLDCKLSDQRDYFLFDCGLAVESLVLQATQMGLIAHPIAGYDPLKVKRALGIPEANVVITLVVVGKPGNIDNLSEKHRELELGARDRKPLRDVMAWSVFTPAWRKT
jgi:peroxiredoxin/nitroreductase